MNALLAHEGHGQAKGLLHYLLEPEHAGVLLLGLAVLLVLAATWRQRARAGRR